ncbi:TetR/AcrR family transcriptional regulator [Actinoplanes sp. NPDC049265]|uniref:TetR/AcrR family transcriptional regulator n=1 Tax=Actinoplanes sp. NPDC049265 TaxID=3363902 RepID=UPI003718BE0F
MSYSTDPRAARSREAILGAARELLVGEGPGAVTHQRVAQQAGVGRATVYRHWTRPESLLLEVMSGADLPYFKEPAAPLRPWLHAQLRAMADELLAPPVAAVALTLMQAAIWDPQIAERRDASVRTINERLGAAVAAAVARGEVETTAERPEITSMLIGPIVYHTAMQQSRVSDAVLDRLIAGIGTWRD